LINQYGASNQWLLSPNSWTQPPKCQTLPCLTVVTVEIPDLGEIQSSVINGQRSKTVFVNLWTNLKCGLKILIHL